MVFEDGPRQSSNYLGQRPGDAGMVGAAGRRGSLASMASSVGRGASARFGAASTGALDFPRLALDRGASSRSSLSTLSTSQNEWWEAKNQDHCGSQFVFHEGSIFRTVWNFTVALLLLYTGTIFLFRVCFLEFHIPEPYPQSDDDGWAMLDNSMSIIFGIDLVLNFFFSYRDSRGVEVDSMRLIAKRYLFGYFAINLLACTPEPLIMEVFGEATGIERAESSRGHTAGVARLARLQRISRLARLTRLARLAKVATFRPSGPTWSCIQHLRGVRVLNNAVGLVWVVHLLACGWYLCAALHSDPKETWVGRRAVDTAGEATLLDRGAVDQWFHAFYFVLTVFTTVGFGDMSAVTNGEIVYVCFTMMVGAVVHSIIISEVINIVTSVDKTQEFVAKQSELVEAFAEHTELDETSQKLMTTWVSYSAKGWVSHRYDREEMKALITDKCIPRPLLGRLPASLFGGQLVQNRFVALRGGAADVPPRLPLHLALAVHKSHFEVGEIVYQMRDFANSVFLVLCGTFADVGRPTRTGGIDEPAHSAHPELENVVVDTEEATTTIKAVLSTRGVKSALSAASPPARQSTLQEVRIKPRSQHLYPYKLYGHNEYFGLAEVLDGRERCSTVRCESDAGGTVLVLPRHDLFRLMEEFPQFALAWRSQSRRRENNRLEMRARLTTGMNCRRLAAVRLQKAARSHGLAVGQQAGAGPEEAAPPPGAGQQCRQDRLPRQIHEEASPFSSEASRGDAPGGATPGSAPGGGAAAAPEPRDLRLLLAASDRHARDVRELRAGVDALRSDFSALRGDLRAALGAKAEASNGRTPALQSAAYPTAQASV